MTDQDSHRDTFEKATTQNHPVIAHLRVIARTMDELIEIPILGLRIGLDGILGLVPIVGDFSGFVVSGYTLVLATQLRVPKIVLLRMFANILIDALIGSIPMVGDIFDFAWKANTKNVALLERYLERPSGTRRGSWGFLLFLLAILSCTLIGLIYFGIWLIRAAIEGFNLLIQSAG